MNFALLLTFKLTLLWLYFGKSCKTTLFRKPTEVSQNTPTFISIGPPITKSRSFKNMKNLCFFWWLLFLEKSYWHLEFLNNQIFGQRFIILRNWGRGVNYCWNYWRSKLLLHFIEYCLDQLNSKHTKTGVNQAIQYFEGYPQKEYLQKIWSFLVHPPQNVDSVKFLWYWTKTIF